MDKTILRAENINHSYRPDRPILQEINLTLNQGEAIAIQGPSGVGKTTLLEILGTMRSPSSGQVKIMGENVYAGDRRQQALIRGNWLGFVFQEALLLPDLTIWENCRLAVDLAGRHWSSKQIYARFEELISLLGLNPERRADYPAQFSTGERQRIAIVRALIHKPRLLIADEPTGNLDHRASSQLIDLLTPLVQQQQVGMIIATHDPVMANSIKNLYVLEETLLKSSNIQTKERSD